METTAFNPHRISIARNESGAALIIALLTMSLLTVVGTAAMNTTVIESKMSGNMKTNLAAFYAAEAGLEHGRQFLFATAVSAGDFVAELQAADGSDGVLVDSTDVSNFPDDDVAFIATTSLGSSTYPRYTVYLTNDDDDGVTVSGTDANATVTLTAIGEGPDNSEATLQIEVSRAFGPPINSPLYSANDVTGNGSSLSSDGTDDGVGCGGTDLPPIYTLDPATTTLNGSPTLTGNPATPVSGTNTVDIQAAVDDMKSMTDTTIIADVVAGTTIYLGTAADNEVLYSDTANPNNVGGLKISNRTGYGVLLVQGDLELAGGFTWYGLILVTGTLTFNGGGGPGVNIVGAILAQSTVAMNGNIDIDYNSCMVENALSTLPLTIKSWNDV